MTEKLSSILGTGSYLILYEMNKAEAQHFLGKTPNTLRADKKLCLDIDLKRFEETGIGKIKIIEFNPKEERIRLRIENNFYADLCNNSTSGNAIIHGLLAGMYESIFKKDATITIISCISGKDPCEIEIIPKSLQK